MDSADDTPEQIATLDNPDARSAFHALNGKQQNFILVYLKTWNGAEAYRQSYNPLADENTARSCGSRLVANANVKVVLDAFRDFRDQDLDLVRRTFTDAAMHAIKPVYGKGEDGQSEKIEDIPDHAVRVKAGEALAKLHGLNAAEKKQVTGTLTIQSTATDENL